MWEDRTFEKMLVTDELYKVLFYTLSSFIALNF